MLESCQPRRCQLVPAVLHRHELVSVASALPEAGASRWDMNKEKTMPRSVRQLLVGVAAVAVLARRPGRGAGHDHERRDAARADRRSDQCGPRQAPAARSRRGARHAGRADRARRRGHLSQGQAAHGAHRLARRLRGRARSAREPAQPASTATTTTPALRQRLATSTSDRDRDIASRSPASFPPGPSSMCGSSGR